MDSFSLFNRHSSLLPFSWDGNRGAGVREAEAAWQHDAVGGFDV
jgi:hypothetical protein